jgi:hypothetical protein
MRSREERTVRMLMDSWMAIWGVGAALGDQGNQLPFPGAELVQARRLRLLWARGGEQGCVLIGGLQGHGGAAFLGCPRPGGSQGVRCLPPGSLTTPNVIWQVG